jgi:hypothetical protein
MSLDLTKISVDYDIMVTPPPPIPHKAPDSIVSDDDDESSANSVTQIQLDHVTA